MAKSLTIAGVDRWKDYRRGTLEIAQELTYQADSAAFCVKGTQPAEWSEVIIEDSDLTEPRLFGGIITKVELVKSFYPGNSRVWKCTCSDYTVQFDKLLVIELYENMTGTDIVLDFVPRYCSGFTTTGVRSGAPTIESSNEYASYKRPSEVMTWLCQYTGWQWYIDYYKVVHFFDPSEEILAAPMSITPGGRFWDFGVSFDREGLRNRVYVFGGGMLSDYQNVQWKADGVATQWPLLWQPYEISYNGVLNTIGVGGTSYSIIDEASVVEGETYDFLINSNDLYIKCSSASAPAADSTMEFDAKQLLPVETYVEDISSQAAIAAIEGGDGVYEHYINDDKLVTLAAAYAAGYADLKDWADPRITGSFRTTYPGWHTAQTVNIALPERGISNSYVIQRVSATLTDTSEWIYTVNYGGRLFGIADFLKALVSAQEQKVASTNVIHSIAILTDNTLEPTDSSAFTERALPYVMGDTDAIMGFVLCSD